MLKEKEKKKKVRPSLELLSFDSFPPEWFIGWGKTVFIGYREMTQQNDDPSRPVSRLRSRVLYPKKNAF